MLRIKEQFHTIPHYLHSELINSITLRTPTAGHSSKFLHSCGVFFNQLIMHVELYKGLIKPYFVLNYTKHLCKLLNESTDHVTLNGRHYVVAFFQASYIPLQDTPLNLCFY